ncbi:MAG: hypothetical protein HYT16_01840 [DPANN group archaeon]|nr:hypothetical protein [DPANN group archaeon]
MALFGNKKKKEDEYPLGIPPPPPGLPPIPPPPMFGQPPNDSGEPMGPPLEGLEPPVPPVWQIPHTPIFIPNPEMPQIKQRISELRGRGFNNNQIASRLKTEGYPADTILAELRAGEFMQGAGFETPQGFPQIPPGMPRPPPPPSMQEQHRDEVVTLLTEDIQQISESIIAEKWSKFKKDFESVQKWRDDAEGKMNWLVDEIDKLRGKMDGVEKSVMAKMDEYSKGISDVSTELKAMQKIFQTVMPQFTANIKELQALVEKKKKEKGSK